MRVMLIRLNDTLHWSEDIRSRVVSIFSYYLFDEQSATYCCELTPSHFLLWVGFDIEMPDGESVPEELYEAIEFAYRMSDNDGYYHCHTIKSLPDDRKKPFLDGDALKDFLESECDGSENEYQILEKMMEAYQANPIVF